MGVKLFSSRKKNKQSPAKTPSKAGTKNAAVITPDTAPGSPIPQEDVDLPASTPKYATTTTTAGPTPTSYNQRIMESETPLVSNVGSNPQFGRDNSSVPQLNDSPSSQQVKSNQIRDEIGQYYDMRDRQDAKELMANNNNKKKPTTEKKMHVTKTFAVQHEVGVRTFSVDEGEDVEVQLLNQPSNYGTTSASQRMNISTVRSRSSSAASEKLVPKFVSKPNQDEVSIPSVITDPEGTSVKGLTSVKEDEILNETQPAEPESTWSKVSLKNKVIDGGQSIDDAIKSLFSTDQKTSEWKTSAATQAGGIEQLLGFLQCNEDTTCGHVLMPQCDTLCGVEEKDVVDLEIEQEQQFALKFNNQIIRDGIKVIYHEPPKKLSTTSDWTQSTVKIFLRPGDCHDRKLKQPCLSWAVLQVASRFNDDNTFNTEEKCLWHRVELLDVDTIVAAPEESVFASRNGGWSQDSESNSVSTSTFFSMTTHSTGSVHIFEAGSVLERDYIIRGMKGIISRLAFNIIAGNTDVIGEHYSEDAGQMTGELPSLRSPRQALRDLTHSFLDEEGREKKKMKKNGGEVKELKKNKDGEVLL